MNRTRIISLLVSALATGAALWFYLAQPRRMPAVPAAAPASGPAADLAVAPPPRATPSPVPIQDGKTLDFSGGTAVVKESDASKASLEQGLKEIDEATKSITFQANPGPTPTPTPAK